MAQAGLALRIERKFFWNTCRQTQVHCSWIGEELRGPDEPGFGAVSAIADPNLGPLGQGELSEEHTFIAQAMDPHP